MGGGGCWWLAAQLLVKSIATVLSGADLALVLP